MLFKFYLIKLFYFINISLYSSTNKIRRLSALGSDEKESEIIWNIVSGRSPMLNSKENKMKTLLKKMHIYGQNVYVGKYKSDLVRLMIKLGINRNLAQIKMRFDMEKEKICQLNVERFVDGNCKWLRVCECLLERQEMI